MTRDDIRDAIVASLLHVAPDADAAGLDPDADFGEALELDSMDFLNVVVAWKARLGVDVPEADYAKVRSLNAAIDYLAPRAVTAAA